jgi:hypothetical protein
MIWNAYVFDPVLTSFHLNIGNEMNLFRSSGFAVLVLKVTTCLLCHAVNRTTSFSPRRCLSQRWVCGAGTSMFFKLFLSIYDLWVCFLILVTCNETMNGKILSSWSLQLVVLMMIRNNHANEDEIWPLFTSAEITTVIKLVCVRLYVLHCLTTLILVSLT